MRYTHRTETSELDIRLLNIEQSVEALTKIVATMTDMLGTLNLIAAHYADHALEALPSPVQRMIHSSIPSYAPTPTGHDTGYAQTPSTGCGCAKTPPTAPPN